MPKKEANLDRFGNQMQALQKALEIRGIFLDLLGRLDYLKTKALRDESFRIRLTELYKTITRESGELRNDGRDAIDGLVHSLDNSNKTLSDAMTETQLLSAEKSTEFAKLLLDQSDKETGFARVLSFMKENSGSEIKLIDSICQFWGLRRWNDTLEMSESVKMKEAFSRHQRALDLNEKTVVVDASFFANVKKLQQLRTIFVGAMPKDFEIVVCTREEFNAIMDKRFGEKKPNSKSKKEKVNAEQVEKPQPLHPLIVDKLRVAINTKAKDMELDLVGKEKKLVIRFKINDRWELQETNLRGEAAKQALATLKNASTSGRSAGGHECVSGTFHCEIDEKEIGFRMALIPNSLDHNNPSINVRMLKNLEDLPNLEHLGFLPEQLEQIQKHIEREQGMVLLTGGVGSGKNTTILQILNAYHAYKAGAVKIVSAEKNPEIKVPHMTQYSFNPNETLKDVMPVLVQFSADAVYVGEVVSDDEINTVYEFASKGHLTHTTIHGNSALGVLRSLFRKVDPDKLESTSLIIAQRLVKKVCPCCSQESKENVEIENFGKTKTGRIPNQNGCDNDGCRAGFVGEMALGEVLFFTPEMQEFIVSNDYSSAMFEEFKKLAKESGFISMREITLRHLAEGNIALADAEKILRGLPAN